MEALQRRADFLRARVAGGEADGVDLSYDKGELSALLWAIPRLARGGEASQATVAENWKIAAELVTAFQRLDDMAWEENTTLAGTKTLHAAVIKAMEALKRQPPSSSAAQVTDRDVLMRFQRWQLQLNADQAHEFWNDIEWLRAQASRGYVPQEDGSRESFERWLVETYDSNADFDVARNCYKEFAVHMAWQAWRAR